MVRQSISLRILRKTGWRSQCEWGHPCNSSCIFIPSRLSPLALKRSLCTEKFCSWAEETSIWLRNNTVSQSNCWLSTSIWSNFNLFSWKMESLSEEKKYYKKVLLADCLKLVGFRYFLGGKHSRHQMGTCTGMGSLLGLIRNLDNLSYPLPKNYQNICTRPLPCIYLMQKIKLVMSWYRQANGESSLIEISENKAGCWNTKE